MASDILFSDDYLDQLNPQKQVEQGPVTVFGLIFKNDEERRQYFREELRRRLPELRKIEGFPIGEDDDIINLSDPPYYTACPNPWLNDFIAQWEEEKKELQREGRRKADFEVKEPYPYGIHEQKNNPIYVAHSYHTKVPPEVIMNYYLYYTQPGDIVVDGFAGTGMAGVAANQCGAPFVETKNIFETKWKNQFDVNINWGYRNAILGDLSPITSYITYNYCNTIESSKFVKAATEILSKLENDYGYLYELNDPNYGLCKIYYFVWSELQTCPLCGHEFVMWDAAVDISSNTQEDNYSCPSCGYKIHKRSSIKTMVTDFDSILGETVSHVDMVPVFVSFEDKQGKRHERELTLEERVFYKSINIDNIPFVPICKLEKGVKTTDPYRIGINHLHQFYSRRNLIILSHLKREIEKYDCDERLKAFLRIWFTSSQSRLHLMNRYAVKHHRHVGPLSNTLYVSATPTEISPFYFVKSKIKDNGFNIESQHNIANQVISATHSMLPDECIDYIFTDPPFGANIMYSELNFIWESWLGIKTNNKEEAIVNEIQNKALPDYQNIMLRCFKEYYRILKPGRWITIEFSNTSAAVWNCIQLALQQSGFVVSTVSDLNKGRAGLHGIIGVVAVNQDLAISCYKPSKEVLKHFESQINSGNNVWLFIDEYLKHLPVHLKKDNSTAAVIERSPKILYDRLISYYVQKGYAIPMDAHEFQQGLREHYVERDGMFFTATQAAEYEEKKLNAPEFVPMGIIVSDEANGVEWLKNELRNKPQTRQDIFTNWTKAIAGVRKGDVIPELDTLLEENFIQNEDGTWRLANVNDDVDLEKLRTKALLKEFKLYLEVCRKPRGKLKDVRVEAVRAGFKQCYSDKNFADIILVGDRIPQNLLTEDEVLLQYYDIASSKV